MPLITPSHSSNPSTLKDTAPILYPCTHTPGHTHTHPHTALARAGMTRLHWALISLIMPCRA